MLERNLNAALDIGDMRTTLHSVAKGVLQAGEYFKGFDPNEAVKPDMGSHRNLGLRHVSILDDHDHTPAQVVAGATLGATVAATVFTLLR